MPFISRCNLLCAFALVFVAWGADATAATVNYTAGTRAGLGSRNPLVFGSSDSDTVTPASFPATGSQSVNSGAVGTGTQDYRFDNDYSNSDAVMSLDFDFSQGATRGDTVDNSLNAFFTVDEETSYTIDGMMSVSGTAGPSPSSSGFQFELRESGSQLYIFGNAVPQPNGSLTINDTNGIFGSRTGVLLPGRSYAVIAFASTSSEGQATLANGTFSLTLGAVAVPEPGCFFPLLVGCGLIRTRIRRR